MPWESNSKRPYEAVSHCWGSQYPDALVQVQSPDTLPTAGDPAQEVIVVTASWISMLNSLAYGHRSRMLWVDMIFINQEDLKERGRQVRYMHVRYRCAQRVIVWLGPGTWDSDLASAWFRRHAYPQHMDAPDPDRRGPPGTSRMSEQDAVFELLGRPWFRRLWVWQEAKLAGQESIIKCGAQEMLLRDFSGRAQNFANKSPSVLGRIQPLLSQAAEVTVQKPIVPFLHTLLELTKKECKDPRDKIYGALGLAPPVVSSEIFVDYDAPIERVYTRAFATLMRLTSRVDFLVACKSE